VSGGCFAYDRHGSRAARGSALERSCLSGSRQTKPATPSPPRGRRGEGRGEGVQGMSIPLTPALSQWEREFAPCPCDGRMFHRQFPNETCGSRRSDATNARARESAMLRRTMLHPSIFGQMPGAALEFAPPFIASIRAVSANCGSWATCARHEALAMNWALGSAQAFCLRGPRARHKLLAFPASRTPVERDRWRFFGSHGEPSTSVCCDTLPEAHPFAMGFKPRRGPLGLYAFGKPRRQRRREDL
jgi:hypothetical protein